MHGSGLRLKMLVDLLFKTVESLDEFREALKKRDGAEPDAIVETGRAGNHFASRDVMRDGRLRGENDAVAYGAMTGNAHLSGENDIVADDGAAGEAGLRADQGVVADAGAVPHLNEIVDLSTIADFSSADGRAI